MAQTIVAEIRSGRWVVGLVALGAIGSIAAARYHVAGVPVIAGVPIVARVPVVARVIVSVVVAIIIGVVVATVAVTQRATGS
jgi:hypothetical protein